MPFKSWTKKNKIWAVVLIAGLVLVAVKWQGRGKNADGALSAPIKRGTINESVYGIGTVRANRSFQFKPGITNTVHQLFVQEGTAVKEGDALVQLDGGLIVKAPFGGTVTSLPFKVGENVFAQSTVLDLTDLQDRYLVVSLEQRGALRVRRGQPARLSFDGMREATFDGIVDSVYSSGNSFLVRINIANMPPQVLPGMSADVAISIRERQNVLLVPVSAVNENRVQVRRGGMTQTITVETGIVDRAMAEVTGGDLKEGDRVILPKKPTT